MIMRPVDGLIELTLPPSAGFEPAAEGLLASEDESLFISPPFGHQEVEIDTQQLRSAPRMSPGDLIADGWLHVEEVSCEGPGELLDPADPDSRALMIAADDGPVRLRFARRRSTVEGRELWRFESWSAAPSDSVVVSSDPVI